MPVPRKKDSALVALAWVLNIAGIFAIGIVALIYWALNPSQAASASDPQAIYTAAMPATYTPASGIYYLPTITPNPRSTMIVVETPTPFLLKNGQHPAVIGYSVSSRPLEVYKFGSGQHERMIVAGIHGGYEWNTIALADELITYINGNPDVVPQDVTLYVLRNLNPDGDARDHGEGGRVNDHGVDLNRNFPINWAATWDRDGCWNNGPSTGGTGPGSEPEAKALMNFLRTHQIEVMISYHSAALGVFPGGEPWEKNSYRFAKALSRVTNYPFPPLDTGCKFTGTLADYAVSLGAVAVDMELSTHTRTDFDRNVKALKILLNWEN